MEKINCDVVRDLMPLVKDNIASESSKSLVEEHIKICNSCKKEFDDIDITEENIEIKEKDEKKLVRNFMVNIEFLKILFIALAIGIVLSTSVPANVFVNIIIMPSLGALSYILFGKKYFIVPIVVFITEFIYQLVINFNDEGATFISNSIYGFIYIVLLVIGAVIIELLKYGFRKEGKKSN